MVYEKKQTLAWEVTGVTIMMTVLSNVGPCSFVNRYQLFKWMCGLHPKD